MIEIDLSEWDFEKIKNARDGDNVIFCCDNNNDCITVKIYDAVKYEDNGK